ncbi:hypothetical protein DFJ58DRAFT_784090 [Suillus subalutaceus]|uniref:uncharacterized protein n=1 Tax=Suillus subalutaceus TaxID=48586 RepID=UPI001B873CF8|nr:uncharacterized protein DFJ58DRAFT_784090 [Suillus subalutaceus]KAG1857023.1 hypothetical protein DFJ58DRAFT_784090 [Suillus subalutaceus]
MPCSTIPLVILIDPYVSLILPRTFTTDSRSLAPCLAWLNFIRLHWSSVPLAILIDTRLLTTLPTALKIDFSSGAVLSDLDEATELHQDTSLLCPTGHSDILILNNLAISLHDRFGQLNIPSDLDEAIEIGLHQIALALLLADHSVVDLCQVILALPWQKNPSG